MEVDTIRLEHMVRLNVATTPMALGDSRCYSVEPIRTLRPKNPMISSKAPNPAFGTTTIADGVTLRVTPFFLGGTGCG